MERSPFDRGRGECQIGAGAFSSVQRTTHARPGFADVDLVVRGGIMLSDPAGPGIFRGNFEFLLEGMGALLVEGPGTGYAGVAAMLRYHFVQPGARCVPYFQVLGGGIYNDIHESHPQRVFGQALAFNLGAGLGLRVLCGAACAFFLEANFRHVSNADTASRNLGLNAAGGLLGVSVFF